MIELSAAADKLLEELKGKGVRLSLNGEKLRVQGELSDELKEQVMENKKGLIQLVQAGEHKLPPVIWIHRPEDNRTVWRILNALGETTPSTPVKERPSAQLTLTGASK